MDAVATYLIWCGIFLLLGLIAYQNRSLHGLMNSRLSELLVATRSLSRAEGFKAGQEEEQAKQFEKIENLSRSIDKTNRSDDGG